ncbi:DUF1553 domain-containing protein [Haloferula sp.]|uniref:DUF1553 domain-containing protein n=1 Tax=Haloferula sp. TaxID=2497595 RepID=UPI00329A9111
MRFHIAFSALVAAPLLTLFSISPESHAEAPSALRSSLPDEVSFNEHIQPILSEYCYHCHGPDEKTRLPEDAPYRLDIAEEALAPRENGKPTIIKGDPDASLLIKLIRSHDPDTVMPPPRSHKELKPLQIALLEKWVEQGAEYQEHWSLIPVERPTPPDSGSKWSVSAIDPFIHAKLSSKGLEPNPQENPARFYRRLHFDLTGLPPSAEDIEAFTWDNLGAEVDRLLETTASAEHYTRYWLDAARYGDTHGIHNDNYRSIWPYRDWVIKAFKANMPFDQFTIEQIGADLLPEPTLDQLIATGFNRCLPTTGEGGAIAEEYEAVYAQDRTNTTSAVWLGLTVGCAACHDHKFDPISQKDTYAFNAFFRNTTMRAMDGNNAEHPPNVFVPIDDDRSRTEALTGEISELKQALKDRRKAARSDYKTWLTNATFEAPTANDPSLSVHLPLNEESGPIRSIVDGEAKDWPAEYERMEAPGGHAPIVSQQAVKLGNFASFSRGDQVTFGGFIRIEGTPSGAVIARMDRSENFRGWDLYLQNGRIASHVIDTWSNSANKIVARKPLTPKGWHHVMVTFDGRKNAKKAMTLHVDGKPVASNLKPNNVGKNIEIDVPLTLGSRYNDDSNLTGGKVAFQDFRFYRRLLTEREIFDISGDALIQQIHSKPVEEQTKQEKGAIFDYYISRIDPKAAKIQEGIDALDTEMEKIRKRGSVTLIMKEKADSEPHAHILDRGEYTNKGEKVTANTPSALPPMPDGAPSNRLGLARWLVSPDNPLTARVTMNRLWYQFFGTGIVETVEDFGIMGARPSHPLLLDWLASEFMDSGWDRRHMIKTIVTSATYRQSQRISPEKLEIDPANRLISRGPRYRLDAELIRDLALASSGLLSGKIGGPSVKPYQPEGVWESVAMKQSNTRFYKESSGDDLYRRSLYTFLKRSAPHPSMEILNATARDVFCVRRELTNTPLQAFVTLNDPQFVEASRRLAELAIKQNDAFPQRLDFVSSRLMGRQLADDERTLVRTTYDDALTSFKADPDSAKSLIATGNTNPDAELDPTELAAWTLITSQLLNLDETLTK